MDEAIVAGCKKMLNRDSILWHLGDFSLMDRKDQKREEAIIDQIPGFKYWILGNHDQPPRPELAKYFQWIGNYAELVVKDPEMEDGEQRVVLTHYPLAAWNRSHHGSWHFHGHCHGGMASGDTARVDVGVDGHPPDLAAHWGPISYNDIKIMLTGKHLQKVYHHKPRQIPEGMGQGTP
jgi:calcineurin-like phosphoesterase family protein